ncbi:MAG: phage antirepressor KilAC domain-containing protein [Synergistaceae bacterium]|nr:phage antirepressor KilAC domain-containing protein [Synergistaceae bacterium]
MLALPGSITFQAAAQFLSQNGFSTGQNRLFRYCRDKKLICSRKGRQRNKPSQRALEQGLFSVELSSGFNAITMITPRGLSRLVEMLSREQYPLCLMMEAPEED